MENAFACFREEQIRKRFTFQTLWTRNQGKGSRAKFLYMIDLDGAFTGGSKNLEVVSDIVHESGLQVQLGGGMRDESSFQRLLNIGVKQNHHRN